MSLMQEIQKELQIRKRLNTIFVKQRDDFDSKEEFDDFLEQVEDLVYNLAHNVNVIEAEQRIREYEAANRASIQAHRAKQVGETVTAAAAQAYQPAAFIPPAAAAQPTPVGAYDQNADGVLQPRAKQLDKQQWAAAAKAAGWTADIVQQRALQEAFRTMFVC